MPKQIISIDPITRIEGHLKIEIEVDGGKVVNAHSTGTLFRGLEIILKGRDPRDAQLFAQRICGVCPTPHAMASTLCLDDGLGVVPTNNGRIMRNLIYGADYLQSHILHFYHLAALDFVKGPDPAPFTPRFEGDYRLPQKINDAAVAHYIQALEMRRTAHSMGSLFAGKMPHQPAIVPGGVTSVPTQELIDKFAMHLAVLQKFINEVYLPDVVAVAEVYPDYFGIGAGCKNMLCYGVFDIDSSKDYGKRKRFIPMGRFIDGKVLDVDPGKITEDVKYSWFSSGSGLYPGKGETVPDPNKKGAYSWVKSPRYDGKVYEVGPLSRMVVTHLKGANKKASDMISSTLAHFHADTGALFSVLGRHAARAIEAKIIADTMQEWLKEIKVGEPACAVAKVPDTGVGMGLTDAPRGSLGHWIRIENKVIANYQAVVPTTWNASPRDDRDQPGPIEQALIGAPVPDPQNPFAPVRIVRAFDPCLACAIHVIDPKGKELAKFKIS